MAARLYLAQVRESSPPKAEESLAAEWVQDFVSRLESPLLGFVPVEERLCFVEEVISNFEGRRDQHIQRGLGSTEATRLALEKLGPAQKLGESFVYEYLRHRGTGVLARYAGKPVWWAFVLFGQASIIALVLLFGRLYLVSPEPNTFGLSVYEARKLLPEPWPLPDSHPSWTALWIYALIAPMVAGFLLGITAPFSNLRPALAAVLSMALLTFALVSHVPSVWEGTLLAYVQLLWWVPVGALFSCVGSVATIRFRLARDPWSKIHVP